ncbi:urea ABC transporter permease subunit UrtB [Pontivivens insulae]|uniref:High-affinity branched-chain amino acid transport system permease protein LivH n=1 Tax=Pontivivens insulae TaxID=1639689 RepID=A0A2R8A7R7_9RHOB|nr:amino acid/amide ABC transporter membrane protein 1 (HAAT family) [Pontivivens insulae]SPF28274.1 High-affinity branched-chain amino acid transport system permease protein LivH [Pontivivens insulae]
MKIIDILTRLALVAALAVGGAATAQTGPSLQTVLDENRELIVDASRRTVQGALDALVASGQEGIPAFLESWQAREVYVAPDGAFVLVQDEDADPYTLLDIETGDVLGTAGKREVEHLRPNRGVQNLIGAALVQFQLSSPDAQTRLAALDAIDRSPDESQLPLLRAMIAAEQDPDVLATAQNVLTSLTIAYAEDDGERVAAIEGLGGRIDVAARATLNPLLATRRAVAEALPEDTNIAEVLQPGTGDLPRMEAYQMLVEADLAPAFTATSDLRAILTDHIVDDMVGGVPVRLLDTDAARFEAYAALAAEGTLPPLVTEAQVDAALASHVFFDQYREPSKAVTDAASETLAGINTRVGALEIVDLSLDGLSLVSIYFLAAIGLAITFGVMGVINMAHGEFIMMGAYTGYLVQAIVPDYTIALVIALPLAFVVTFGAGVGMERLVIRKLYHRPLETLLATFGISIALQQIVRQVFGAQARPLTPPDWLAGSLDFNDVVSISYIRIAIFALGLVFFVLLWLILNRTRLGLEVRAVTQNPAMASSMGINPDRINMLTFGLGSGIAGIAGVAIGLFAQVTPELGTNYIVQSFMTVVVGGVGNIFGTLAGASLIGFLQKGIEWLNPSNTLAAQTYMILFVILFIQFRPRGIIALKGRAAGD